MSSQPVAVRADAQRRRGAELGMLIFAVAVGLAAWANVDYAQHGSVGSAFIYDAVTLVALAAIAHVVVRRVALYADPLLLPAVTLLNGLGLALIHRLDLAAAEKARQLGRTIPGGDAPHQLLWTTLGIVLFVAVLLLLRDHRLLQRYTYTAMAAGLILLALPAVLPARFSVVHGARIWIRLPGFSLQPSEVAKLLLMVFFAGYLVAKRDVLSLATRRFAGVDLPRGRDLGPVLVAWLASLAVLIRENDLGTSLLFFGIFVVMLYVATERTSWLLIGVGLFVGGAFAAAQLISHVTERFDIWLHPFADPSGSSYQLVQGLFGLATGGIIGTGLGQGQPDSVPFAKTDFIVATMGEELGLVGLMALLVLFAVIVERGLRTSLAVRDSFGKLLAAGLAFALAIQVFVQVGGVTRLIPLTGLTLPFVSYGGSSLVANWVLIALLLRISDAARQPAPAPVTPSAEGAQALTEVVRT